jgi:hypothetical protein
MEPRRRARGAGLVIALLAVFAWQVLRPHGAVYRGRPLGEWMEEAYSERVPWRPPGAPCPAELALRERGAAAIPLLLGMAGTHAGGFRDFVGMLASDSDAAWLQLPPQRYKHDMAAWGFGLLGPAAAPAVPDLTRLLHHPEEDVRLAAVECLGALGTNAVGAVPGILEVFQREAGRVHRSRRNPDLTLFEAAARALGEMGAAAAPAVPALQGETNQYALIARLRIQGASLEPFFARLGTTTNQGAWQEAETALNQMALRLGPAAEPALPHLISAIAATNQFIHCQAIACLGTIRRRPDLCLPALLPLLCPVEEVPQARDTVCQVLSALGQFGPAAAPAFGQVRAYLASRDEGLRILTTNTLMAIDPAAAARAGVRLPPDAPPANR